MQKAFKTAIIGGGASGLMTAVELLSGEDALSFGEVLILERNDRVGKKLIATGNGQGNLLNHDFGVQFYHGDKEFISKFVDVYNKLNLKEYLENLGIPLTNGNAGKVYPLSRQASAVLDILRNYLERKGCKTVTNAKVIDLKKQGENFIVKTENEEYFAEKVVLATGGSAGKQFGTDGSSYGLAKKFGHKLSELSPSLVQLKTNTDTIRGLKGLKEVCTVSLEENGKRIFSSTGDLLFTDFGVSGNSIFQVSAYIEKNKEYFLNVEFLPEMTESEVTKLLTKRFNIDYFNSQDILSGIINKRIGQAVLKTVKEFTPKGIAYQLKRFKLKVTGDLGFNYAQVTKGGIYTDKIVPTTYESQLQKGLYIVGEALNVDGDCGGYNVSFAFVSGISSAKDIKNKLTH